MFPPKEPLAKTASSSKAVGAHTTYIMEKFLGLAEKADAEAGVTVDDDEGAETCLRSIIDVSRECSEGWTSGIKSGLGW